MNQANRDFETFLTKYKLTMDALTKSQFKKAHQEYENILNSISRYIMDKEFLSAKKYYYSVVEPTESGDYWHYDAGGKPILI